MTLFITLEFLNLRLLAPIKRNHIGQGVMSPLYTAFRFKDENVLDYLEQYFNTTMWHRYMHSIANFWCQT